MSGHSKWSQIKRQKAVTDLKKGQTFSKYSKAIYVAVKEGGSNPEFNFKLRLLLEKAKREGMPSDSIDRAVKKGSGEDKGVQITSVLYEGLGPAGSAFLVECATDNSNRTLQEIRQIFLKNNGRLAESGSVSWNFQQKGLILATSNNPDEVTLQAIDAGAQDVNSTEEGLEIHTKPADLMKVKDAISQKSQIHEASISWIALQPIEVSDSEKEKIEKLENALENAEDTVEVYNNLI